MLHQIRYTIQLAIGMVFLFSVIAKIRSPRQFAHGIAAYRIIPVRFATVASLLVITIEGWLAAAHLSGFAATPTAAAGAVVLMGFGVAVALNLRHGRTVPCFCFGDTGEKVSKRTLIRIGLLLMCEVFLIVANQFPLSPVEKLSSFLSLSCAMLVLFFGAWLLSVRDLAELFLIGRENYEKYQG